MKYVKRGQWYVGELKKEENQRLFKALKKRKNCVKLSAP